MDSENLAVFHAAIDKVNSTHVHSIAEPLAQYEIDDLTDELLCIRTALDYLTKRKEELRQMAFEAMDVEEVDQLPSRENETVVTRQLRGNKPFLDPDKIRIHIREFASNIILQDLVNVGIDEGYLEELLADGLVTQEQIKQCFSHTAITPALTFEVFDDQPD